jgi:tetratricopeptide (TPR) repeat protein
MEEAARAFTAALEKDPAHRAASLNLCNVLLPLRGASEAIACFKKLVHRDPNFVQATSAAAGVLHLENHHEEAAFLYRRVLALDPNNAAATHGLSALSGDSSALKAPVEYVRDMFDGYAPSFDASLEALEYSSPYLLRKKVDEVVGPGGSAEHVCTASSPAILSSSCKRKQLPRSRATNC